MTCHSQLSNSSAEFVVAGGFGEGTGLIWLDELICTGNETDVSQCSHQSWGATDCFHNEDVGLVCTAPTGMH